MSKPSSQSRQLSFGAWGILAIITGLCLFGLFLVFRSHAATQKADLNGDGKVDNADLAILQSHYNQTGSGIVGDINSDGQVNWIDLSQMAAAWSTSTSGFEPYQAAGNTDKLPQALKFDDEFDGNSLDLSKWQPNWLGSSNTAITHPPNGGMIDCEDPAQVSEGGGVLKLTLVQRSCAGYSYASGYATTVNSYHPQYGYFEARMYLPPGSGACTNWSGFWTNGMAVGGVQWPVFLEDDVMECLGGHMSANVHAGPSANNDAWKKSMGGIGAASGWHILGTNIQPGPQSLNCSGSTPDPLTVSTYYDGVKLNPGTYSVCAHDTGEFMNLQNDAGSSGGTTVAPSTVQVDYARSWQ